MSPNAYLDNFINRITMYRLVLYVLTLLLITALIASFFGELPIQPLNLFISAALLVTVSYITNELFARTLKVQTNVESVYITAFILTLIISPPSSFSDVHYIGFMILAAVTAQASKYLLVIFKKHIFNPAVFGVAVTAATIQYAATWWVGDRVLLPLVLICGLLIVRKICRAYMVLSFFVTLAVLTILLGQNGNSIQSAESMLWNGVTLFFAFIMFTEPQTTPPTRNLQILYGVLVGALYAPFFHVGAFYFTPELALLTGNIFSFIVSPKQRLLLTLKEKSRVAENTFHFVFHSSHALRFRPGQYLEWTLAHPKPDTRGNRRYFTVASSPLEPGVHAGIKFYEDSSSFKKKLAQLKPGDTLSASHVAGDFTLPKNTDKKLVFLAGGIGITPFRSMISHLLHKNEKRDIVLLYSARSPKDLAYKEFLDEASLKLPLKIVYAVTHEVPHEWPGHTGFINRSIIEQEAPDFQTRAFYLSGPRSFVNAFENLLREMGIPKRNIKKDFFPGYA